MSCFLDRPFIDTIARVSCFQISDLETYDKTGLETTVYAINSPSLSELVTRNAPEFLHGATVSLSRNVDAPVYYYLNSEQGPLCIYEFKIPQNHNSNMYIVYLPLRKQLCFLAGNGVVEEQNLFLRTVLEWFAIFDDLYVMHASAVEHKSKSIAFVGDAGAGKTSLSLEFAHLGGKILSDDQVIIIPPAEIVEVYNPMLGLDIGTIYHFGLSDRLLPVNVRQEFDGYTPKQLCHEENFPKVRINSDLVIEKGVADTGVEPSEYRRLSAIVFSRIDADIREPTISMVTSPKSRLFRFLKPWITYHGRDFRVPEIDNRINVFLNELLDVQGVKVFDLSFGLDLGLASTAIIDPLEL